MISEGTTLITWRDIRWNRSSFTTTAKTLYRLKSNSFPLCNLSSQSMLCPGSECSANVPALANHIFWTLPSARLHWKSLRERWRCLGAFKDDYLHVWVSVINLPGVPNKALDDIKQSIDPGEYSSEAQVAVFPADHDIWRFVVATTLHTIWVERILRIEYPSLYKEVHTARDETLFADRFDGFVGQHMSLTWGEKGNFLRK